MSLVEQLCEQARDHGASSGALVALHGRLRGLERDAQRRVGSALVTNPNAPRAVFVVLASVHPLEALGNPAFDLYGIEDPGWFGRLTTRAASALLLAPSGRQRVVDLAALHPTVEVRALAAALELIAPARLRAIVRNESSWSRWGDSALESLRADAARRPRLRGIVAELVAMGRHDPAALPDTWLDALIAMGSYPLAAEDLARNARLGLERQLRLASHGSSRVRARLAGNQTLAPQAARRLAGDPESSVRAALASNPCTPADVVMRLSADPSEAIERTARTRLLTRSR